MAFRKGMPTLSYLTKPEAHTFAFSVAANAILSFFPFMVLLTWLIRNVFRSQTMSNVIIQLMNDHLPLLKGQEFLVRNLNAMVNARQRVELFSLIMLLISSSGVFLPLEVAFNQIWGFTKNRSYLGNQAVSLFLAFACGSLALISVALAAGNEFVLSFILRGSENLVFRSLTFVILKVFALGASIAIFFLLYWLLPHGKVAARSVIPAAVAMGIFWELGKYLYLLALPWLNFREVYGPFEISVTLIFWAFISGLLVLAGAYLAGGQEAVQEKGEVECELVPSAE
ncbi:MAG TPA: YihY/virulence factor BrkB family protein [Candidatus Angelobacter sp.]|nr:YihY/virulence factor BrkB family protein [Candidatus Angelobacter sp.]